MGRNVNGPSLIKTPDWLIGRLGRYHLYFAHHLGSYIRLAYADDLAGPWAIHTPGVLDISQCLPFHEHIASPDVHIDEDRQELRMYLHGITDPHPYDEPLQQTCLAMSFDGLHFALRPKVLGPSYLRVWQWQGQHYALALGGELLQSPDGLTPFTSLGQLKGLPDVTRHTAVLKQNETLWVAWTCLYDEPERIFIAKMDLHADWRLTDIQELLRPEMDWEGADLPVSPSQPDIALNRVHQLRDPCFFSEDGKTYMLYSTAGEAGIAIAELSGLSE